MVRIAWLDASVAEQQRMRELAGLFHERETRDELGLGPVRESLGSTCFPGSSTLHTRARYLLFLPWLRLLAYERGAAAATIGEEIRRLEQQLSHHMLTHSREADLTGLFGARGQNVDRWACDVYNGLLIEHGILLDPAVPGSRRLIAELGLEDITARTPHPSLPAPPPDFPLIEDGFRLSAAESSWLKERILTAHPHTVLAHFLHHPPSPDSSTPWDDPAAATISGPAAEHLRMAEQFSVTLHGAQLLYNLLLARAQQELFTQQGTPEAAAASPEEYLERLQHWAHKAREVTQRLGPWDPAETLEAVQVQQGRRVTAGLRGFLTEWTQVLRAAGPEGISTSAEAEQLVRRRENILKRTQSRFTNRSLLASWSGATGAGLATMRWGASVQRILLDIHQGLETAPAEDFLVGSEVAHA
ncbi:DUF6361 family protein [Nesterenkonia massiliensis]|uniref:DUF6361 family protein n=1 Tax=Nesterenkonia massiliensis TaxID=1232429 RepID=A0ABT2HPV5_9MICC|nr:DUF6361 family protein [Nesterenkonia massiliensis]MCT1606708.1 DUF6361 family protein [Nesterenkonia massiliensis]